MTYPFDVPLATNKLTIQRGFDGDQEVISQDQSPLREGSHSLLTTGGVSNIWTYAGGQPVMKYWSHNCGFDANGNVQGRDEADGCSLILLCEDNTIRHLGAPTGARRTLPVFTLYRTQNLLTGADTMVGQLTVATGTTSLAPITIPAGTLKTTPAAGDIEADATANYATLNTTNGRMVDDAWHLFRLAANGSAISTIADVFGTNDGIPAVTNGVYEIVWDLYGTVATGGTATFTIVNTQTVTNMVADWQGSATAGIAATGALSGAGVVTQTAASVALPTTGLMSAASHHYVVHAIIEAATAGNVRLRLTMSAGTFTPLRGSYFKVRRLPAGNVGTYVA